MKGLYHMHKSYRVHRPYTVLRIHSLYELNQLEVYTLKLKIKFFTIISQLT